MGKPGFPHTPDPAAYVHVRRLCARRTTPDANGPGARAARPRRGSAGTVTAPALTLPRSGREPGSSPQRGEAGRGAERGERWSPQGKRAKSRIEWRSVRTAIGSSSPPGRRLRARRSDGLLLTSQEGRACVLVTTTSLMVFEYIIRSSPRRRASHSVAEGFSPTASPAERMNFSKTINDTDGPAP